VLGYSYLQDSDDTRNSPSHELVAALEQRGFTVAVHDPFVDAHKGDVMEALKGAGCAVLMVAHSEYRSLDLAAAARQMKHAKFVDARGFFEPADLKAAGFSFRTIGVGTPTA
jgi:UDP-N-acetyl-D-mannosaminuronic acid dehydrogenase